MGLDLSTTPELEHGNAPPKESPEVKLGPKHREHIAWMVGKGFGEWDERAFGLNSHTAHVKELVEHFDLPGDYNTVATGSGGPTDRNCILYPIPRGAWKCVRYGGGKEGPTWRTNRNGNAVCEVGKRTTKEKHDPADAIVSAALATDSFFYSEGTAYVKVTRKGRAETLLVESSMYARLLRVRYRNVFRKVCKADWIRNAVDQLAAIAIEEGDDIPVHIRVAFVAGKLYIDLADCERNVVEIDSDGYRVIHDAPVRFLRTDMMQALPIPQAGGSLVALKQFINVKAEDFPLLIGAILGTLHPTGSYPIISFIGGDGHAKTSAALFILALIDPSIIKGCSPPETNEDLVLAVQQRWLYFIDNLSEIKSWLSDSACRLSTGGATERRTKYKDRDTSVFIAKRPQIYTSITQVIHKPDLRSRTIEFDCPQVVARKSEEKLWDDFYRERPRLLGALYTCVSAALKNRDTLSTDSQHRMADFCNWVQAAEPATGLEPGSILKAYTEAATASVSEILGCDLAQKLIAFVQIKNWTGIAKDLVAALGINVASFTDVQNIVAELRTLQTALETRGIIITFRRSNGKKLIDVQRK